jgi:predicted outer membrane repeat protein
MVFANRLTLRRVLAACCIAVLFLYLAGCSSSPPEPSPHDGVQTEDVSGKVNLGEVGGNQLTVLSAWELDGAQVDTHASFTVEVSAVGAQLLATIDESGQPRALTISIPTSYAPTCSLAFDASSTADALLMMSPGVLSVDPALAAARLDSLRRLQSYVQFVNLVRDALPSSTVNDVVADAAVQAAFRDVLVEWDLLRPGDANAKRYGGFDATLEDGSIPEASRVRISNSAWRFVNVYRRELDSSGLELELVPVSAGWGCMSGAEPLSWGSLIFRTFGEPTEATDIANLAEPVGRVQYWAVGMGLDPGTSPPTGVDPSYGVAGFYTVAWYVLFPVIDLIMGTTSLFELGDEGLELTWLAVETSVNLDELEAAANQEDLAAAATDAVVSSISAMSAAGLFGISTTTWWVITVVSAPLSATNIVLAARSWARTPSVCVAEVSPQSDTVITVGASGETDYETIGEAMDVAAPGTQILISPGTYVEHGIQMKSGVRLSGSVTSPDLVVVDGQQHGWVFECRDVDASATMEGMTITGGGPSTDHGGAMYCENSALTLRNMVFSDNESNHGGAVWCTDCNMFLEDIVFENNDARDAGGGMVSYGGSSVLSRVRFVGNATRLGGGGGLAAVQSSTVALCDCVFFNNSGGGGNGGAVYCKNASPSFYGCTFCDNGSTHAGGLYLWDTGTAEVYGCIIAHSFLGKAVHCQSGSTMDVKCTDIYGNAGGDWVGCVAGLQGTDGNLCADPLFCDWNAGDLTLHTDSPCAMDGNECGILIGAVGIGCSGQRGDWDAE